MNPFTTGIQKAIAYGAVTLAVALAASCVVMWLVISSLQSRLDTCKDERAALAGSVQIQNQSIADWKTNADAALELAREAGQKAQAATAAAKPKIEALEAQIQAGAGKSCGQAIQEFREGAK